MTRNGLTHNICVPVSAQTSFPSLKPHAVCIQACLETMRHRHSRGRVWESLRAEGVARRSDPRSAVARRPTRPPGLRPTRRRGCGGRPAGRGLRAEHPAGASLREAGEGGGGEPAAPPDTAEAEGPDNINGVGLRRAPGAQVRGGRPVTHPGSASAPARPVAPARRPALPGGDSPARHSRSRRRLPGRRGPVRPGDPGAHGDLPGGSVVHGTTQASFFSSRSFPTPRPVRPRHES